MKFMAIASKTGIQMRLYEDCVTCLLSRGQNGSIVILESKFFKFLRMEENCQQHII